MGAGVSTTVLDLFKNDWHLLGDLVDFICGDMIGEGNSRMVFQFRMDPKLVVKIDRSGHFDNVEEWGIWNNLKDKPQYAKFLAPCVRISSCGRFLLQEKTQPVKIYNKSWPEKIPDFFSDVKIQNWGKLGKRIVCHDYANHRFMNTDKTKLVKAEWWSDSYQLKEWKQ